MQVAGKTCLACGQWVVLDREGTWCHQCRAIVHHVCLGQRKRLCPQCHSTWRNPAELTHYAARCPGCGIPNPRGAACGRCESAISWDTDAEFEAARSRFHVLGLGQAWLACLGLIAAAGLFIAAILLARIFDSVERFFPGRDAACWLLAGWPIVISFLLTAGHVAISSSRSLNRAWWLIRFH